jgi:hypothetical protein
VVVIAATKMRRIPIPPGKTHFINSSMNNKEIILEQELIAEL